MLLFLISASGKIGLGGVINLNSNVINDIEAGSLNPAASWIVMIVIVALAGLMMYLRDRRRVSGLRVSTHFGVTMTGSRSVRYRSISTEADPLPPPGPAARTPRRCPASG
ncbi:MAG TPA: hypothetical protein VMV92_30540 [Streptosporangiaceae bacterium]|nr:hypothetical protein [Streptosporangiaceae bacterium]